MKFLALALLALAAVASAKYITLEDVIDLEDLTAYGYLSKIGAPLAEKIRKAEEEGVEGRIVGGSAASLGQFPYQAGLVITLTSGGTSVCGGSLIRANRVVTAAHCWWDGVIQARQFQVVLGSIRLFSGGTRVTSTNVAMHGSWSPTQMRNDVAVIRLTSNVGLSSNIAIIALATGNDLYTEETAIASGFGRTSNTTGINNDQFLSHVALPVISNAVCAQTYGSATIQATNICTSGAGGKGPCGGDSGGPLVVTKSDNRILIGINSFGYINGCQRGAPAAFARVTSFASWISSQ